MKNIYLSFGGSVVALLMAACGSSSLAPSPAATRTTASVPVPPVAAPVPVAPLIRIQGYTELWTLSTQDLGQMGSNCVYVGAGGTTVKDGLAVGHDASTLKLLYWVDNYPTDDVEYTATVDASGAFTGQSAIQPMTFPSCSSAGTFQGTVVGQLSPDGRHIDATETWSYQFADGLKQALFRWTADRDQ